MEPVFCLYMKGLQGSSTLRAAEQSGSFQQGAVHSQLLITPNCPSPVRQQSNTQPQSTGVGTPTFPLHTGALGGATGAHSAPIFQVQLLLALPLLLQQRWLVHGLDVPLVQSVTTHWGAHRDRARAAGNLGTARGQCQGHPQALPGGAVELNSPHQSGCLKRSTLGFKLLDLHLVVLNLSPLKNTIIKQMMFFLTCLTIFLA